MILKGPEYIASPHKRCFDIAAACAIGGLLSPLALGATVAAMIDNESFNPFFVQKRIGHDWKEFDLVKLRTIPIEKTQGGPMLAFGTYDERARTIGRILRRSGLDEVPQLFNVLRGDMSVVGIRPELPATIDRFRMAAAASKELDEGNVFDDWYAAYGAGKPGLTSWSALYRHDVVNLGDEELRNSLVLDLMYQENASLETDLEIVLQTPLHLVASALHNRLSAANSQATVVGLRPS